MIFFHRHDFLYFMYQTVKVSILDFLQLISDTTYDNNWDRNFATTFEIRQKFCNATFNRKTVNI